MISGLSKRAFVSGILAAAAFFAVTIPFKEYFMVMEVMGIRPSAMPPVFGLILGLPGILGCAAGNLAADIYSGSPPVMCVLGFTALFAYGLLPRLIWDAWGEIKDGAPPPARLNSVRNVGRYIVVIAANAVIMAVFLGSIMNIMGMGPLVSVSTLMLLSNDIVFCIVLGIPLLVYMSMKKFGVKKNELSLNERLVLIFLLAGVICGGLMGVFAYTEISRSVTDPVTMWMRVYMYIAAGLFGFFIITMFFLRYSEKNITIPVEAVARIAKDFISGGDHEKKDSAAVVAECERLMKNRSETGVLAEAFKKMTLDLDTYIEDFKRVMTENERIAAELDVARQIQADMLPNVFPAFPERNEFELYASMQPAKEVGGDFYDFFFIDQDHLCVVIADVSGKGVPAALFMVIAKTLINNRARGGEDPGDVFSNVSSRLREGNESAMFVTAWMGVIEISTGRITCVNAGHNPPLIKKAGSPFEYMKTRKNLMLAGMSGVKYEQSEFRLDRGDMLCLYTDGVTEANNAGGELYGEKRLVDILNRLPGLSAADALKYIKADVEAFAGGAPQFDDITMLAFRITGE